MCSYLILEELIESLDNDRYRVISPDIFNLKSLNIDLRFF